MNRHPISAAWRDHHDDEYENLVESIRANGLRHPILTFEGEVLDGWHRHQACFDAGVAPILEMFEGTVDEACDVVIDEHVNRRHSTSGEIAIGLAKLDKIRAGRGEKTATVAETAEQAGISPRTLARAIRVEKADPALGDSVRDGEISLKQAEKVVREKHAPGAVSTKDAPGAVSPKATKTEKLEIRVAELEEENRDLRERLLEMSSLLETDMEAQGDENEIKRAIAGYKAQITTYESQLREKDLRLTEFKREVRGLRKQLGFKN